MARGNSGSNNYGNSNNTDNKARFSAEVIRMFGKTITMSSKQMTEEKPQKDIEREP